MIDYDKLRIAHELADKWSKDNGLLMELTCLYGARRNAFTLQFNGEDYDIESIDDVILKLDKLSKPELEPGRIGEELYKVTPCTDGSVSLGEGEYRFINGELYRVFKSSDPQELAKPEPKYKVGQEVWRIQYDQEPINFIVKSNGELIHGEIVYRDHVDSGWPEAQVFPTRQALIEHQLQYWRTQLEDELEQHVSPYCEPKPSCQKCYNYRYASSKLSYDCLCDERNADRCQEETVTTCNQLESPHLLDAMRYTTIRNQPKCNCTNSDNFSTYSWHVSMASKDCQHQSDGMTYTSNPPQYKCIKCGDFYR